MYIFHIGSILSPSSGNPNVSRQQLENSLDLEPQKLRMYQLTIPLAADITLHVSSLLRDLGMIFEKCILSSSTKFLDADPEGTLCSSIDTGISTVVTK